MDWTNHDSWRESLRRVRFVLFPQSAEQDEGFRAEIERLGRLALIILGPVWIATALAGYLFARWVPNSAAGAPSLWELLASLLLGSGMLFASRSPWGVRHARGLVVAVGIVSAAVSTWEDLLAAPLSRPTTSIFTDITMMMLVIVAAAPILPLQALLLGAADAAIFVLSYGLFSDGGLLVALRGLPGFGLFMITLVCAALAAADYQRILESYQAHQRVLEAQSRLAAAENAAAVGRLAATLSHDLNNPAGVLRSAVDSLEKLAAKKSNAPDTRRAEFETMEADLRRVAKESVDAVESIVERMQRFAHLDRAEVIAADLNALLRDAVAMLDARRRAGFQIELDCQPLPPLWVRPQPITMVFSMLLHDALESGPPSGRVSVSTRAVNARVEVTIQHFGPRLSAQDLERSFTPGFQVRDHRIATGNWNLFGARQTIREHGGDIRLGPSQPNDSSLVVTLPVPTPLGREQRIPESEDDDS